MMPTSIPSTTDQAMLVKVSSIVGMKRVLISVVTGSFVRSETPILPCARFRT